MIIHMKKLLLLFILFSLSACKEKKETTTAENIDKMREEWKKNRLDFFVGSTPQPFSAKTMNGHQFNSKDYNGKNLLIFIYGKKSLERDHNLSYNMTDDLNRLFNEYKDQTGFIGILEGLEDDKTVYEKALKDTGNIQFEQIDNTKSPQRQEQIKYNIFCTPARILINSNGKVIHSSCGGATDQELMRKLDSIKTHQK